MTAISVSIDVYWRDDVGEAGAKALERLVQLIISGSGDSDAAIAAAREVAKAFWIEQGALPEVPADKAYRKWLANRKESAGGASSTPGETDGTNQGFADSATSPPAGVTR